MELSGWFNGFATLLAGAGVGLIYWKTKRDAERSAAAILLTDMRDAEAGLGTLQSMGVDYGAMTNVLVLPTNNWIKYKHLFVKKLDSDQLIAIDRFFDVCSSIQSGLGLIGKVLDETILQKAIEIQKRKMENILKPEPGFEDKIKEIERMDYYFLADWYKRKLQDISSPTGIVLNTPAGEQLKKIAHRKF
jgi:hypothetical protein